MANQKHDELLKQIMSVFEKNGPDAALSYIEDCIKKDPNSPEVYLIRGEFYLDGTGNIEGALKDFEKVIKINPNEPKAYYHRGLLYARTGSDNKALNDFSKAIELDANYAEAYANRANMYLKLDELQKAISDCTKAIEISQSNVEPYFNRGLAYMNMNEPAKALEDYNKVIELDPDNVEAYFRRGFLHSHFGNLQEAIRDYEKFLELDPNNKNATLVRDTLSDLRSGKIPSEDTFTGKKSKLPQIIIMIIGAAIGGGVIGSFVAAPRLSTSTDVIIGALIGVFFGIGLGPFLGSVKEWFGRIWNIKYVIKEEQAKRADRLEGCLYGLFYGLLGWGILGFFKLGWALIKSPFVAIYELVSNAKQEHSRIVWAIVGIVLGLVVIAIFIHLFNKSSEPISESEMLTEIEESIISKKSSKPIVTSGVFTDSRDNKTYKTIKIGEQTWLAENLDYEMKGSECYNHNPENCQEYGRLYHWEPALKACPSGWHLPKDYEWVTLADYVGSNAGIKLKSKSGWDSNGTDEYGFSALPSGTGKSDGSFIMLGKYGYWWSIGEGTDAYYRYISSEDNNLNRLSSTKKGLFPIRCIQD